MSNEAALGRDLIRLREASEWVQRLNDSAENEQIYIEWQSWCDADAANLRAFEQMEEVWDGLSPARVARAMSAHASPNESAVRPPIWRQRWTLAASAAALLVVFGTVFWVTTHSPGIDEFRTDIGEIRHEVLPDGSRMD